MVILDLAQDAGAALEKARDCLLAGGLAAFPTESFYGLGADIRQEKALQRLFLVKQRADDHPILILIASRDMLGEYVRHVPHIAISLMDRFWPGGLTLVFEASPRVSPLLTAGSGKIGIRLSGHPFPTALAREIHAPITGTSANLSGQPPCESAESVVQVLGNAVDLIVDGGPCPGGIPSTVLDVTTFPPRILRQGLVREEQMRLGLW